MTFLQLLVALLRLGRPLFLVGGFVLYGLGAAMACYEGYSLQPTLLIWGQLAITATQLMTHYNNDYFDQAADRANLSPTWWSGGSRVLVEGRLSPWWALYLALILLVVALVAIAKVSRMVAPVAIAVLMVGIVLSWFYSAPPLRLHSRGVGELTVAIVVPVLVPLAGYTLQAGSIALLPLLATLPLALFQFAMLLAIGFPDEVGDATAGKRTLVVRLGMARAAQLWRLALVLAVLALPLLLLGGVPAPVIAWLAAFMLPLLLWFSLRLRLGAWAEPRWWSWLAFFSVALFVGSAAVMLVAFLSLC